MLLTKIGLFFKTDRRSGEEWVRSGCEDGGHTNGIVEASGDYNDKIKPLHL